MFYALINQPKELACITEKPAKIGTFYEIRT
jgi:hypothetical protein